MQKTFKNKDLQFIYNYIKEKGFKDKDVAKLLGITKQYLSKLKKQPTICERTLYKFCKEAGLKRVVKYEINDNK